MQPRKFFGMHSADEPGLLAKDFTSPYLPRAMGLDQGGTRRPNEQGATGSGPSSEQRAEDAGGPARSSSQSSSAAALHPAALAGAGIELAVLILAGLYAGQWVDKRLGTAPWLLILGVFVGAAAGFYNVYRILTTADRRTTSRAAATRKPPMQP